MKRILMLLLTMILVKTICFSQNISLPIEQDSIVSITASDLKYANFIFVEHDKLLKENTLLNTQINNYKALNDQLMQIDSLKSSKIVEYQKLNDNYALQIYNLNKEVKKKTITAKAWQIGGITVSFGLILFLILK